METREEDHNFGKRTLNNNITVNVSIPKQQHSQSSEVSADEKHRSKNAIIVAAFAFLGIIIAAILSWHPWLAIPSVIQSSSTNTGLSLNERWKQWVTQENHQCMSLDGELIEVRSPWDDGDAIQGPNRYTFTMEVPADHIVFNSITNNSALATLLGDGEGDERDFVQIKPFDGCSSRGGYANIAEFTSGKDSYFIIVVYINNDAASNLETLVAKDTTLSIHLGGGCEYYISATISSSNSNPALVYDYAELKDSSGACLAHEIYYVTDSMILINNAGFHHLSDSVVMDTRQKGAFIGYDEMNGYFPGQMSTAAYVMFLMHAA